MRNNPFEALGIKKRFIYDMYTRRRDVHKFLDGYYQYILKRIPTSEERTNREFHERVRAAYNAIKLVPNDDILQIASDIRETFDVELKLTKEERIHNEMASFCSFIKAGYDEELEKIEVEREREKAVRREGRRGCRQQRGFLWQYGRHLFLFHG